MNPFSPPVPAGVKYSVLDFDLHGIAGKLLFTIIAVVVTFALYANFIHKDPEPVVKKRDPNLPEPSEIVSLRIYPIKSCRGMQFDKARLLRSGLHLDRNWMFVDAEKMEFLTIRTDATMTLIDTAFDSKQTELTISVHGTDDSVTVATQPSKEWLEANCTHERVTIWGKETDAYSYGDEINKIFNGHFKKPVKLVYKGPEPRPATGSASATLYGKEVPHMFADLMSIQIASEASLADLNAHLKESDSPIDELTIERFRPNIVIKGNLPWEEDRWKTVQIVTIDHAREQLRRVNLDVVCRCARCHVPNVDPDTAEQHTREPWTTLMKFRRVDEGGQAKYKPCFGMLCLPLGDCDIMVGSTLEVLEVTDKHLYGTAKFEDL